MSTAMRRRIEEFSQQKRVHAGSVIVSLFGDAVLPRGGRVWLGSLIRLLEPLGVNERSVRTSVFRLTKEEWLCSQALGRRSEYRLTSSGERRCVEAARQIYAARAPDWDHRWRQILVLGVFARKDRDALRRALVWQGFGAVGADCFVHPSADLASVFDALLADGLAGLPVSLMPLVATDSSLVGTAGNADLVARAWDLRELAQAYAEFVRTYTPVLAELRSDPLLADEEGAFLLRLMLIHDYRRLLLRDPQLPEQLLPADWPGESARLLCKDLYRRLLAPAERHLDRFLLTADGTAPRLQPMVHARFAEEDRLPAI